MPHPLKINTRSELSKYPLKKMDKVQVLGKKKTQTQTHSGLDGWLEKSPPLSWKSSHIVLSCSNLTNIYIRHQLIRKPASCGFRISLRFFQSGHKQWTCHVLTANGFIWLNSLFSYHEQLIKPWFRAPVNQHVQF